MKKALKGNAMRKLAQSTLLAVMMVGLLSCEERTDRTDTGGVLLTVSDFDGLPFAVSVNNSDFVQVSSLSIQSLALNPGAPTSSLMDVELRSYQVRYRRVDAGTRTPRPLVNGFFGNVPLNGVDTINNLVIMGPEQLSNAPLSDLLFINGGFDKETGSPVIKLELELTFFGKTLSGDDVSTNPARFAIDFTP